MSEVSSFTTVTSAAAYGIRVLTDLGQKNRNLYLWPRFRLHVIVHMYLYLFVEKLCPMAVAGCNST